jgi:tetratricopeptide (TPR) repeat protein
MIRGPVGVPELQVEAYKDLANVTRRLGDFEEAGRLLAIADAAADSTTEAEYQHAVVSFARSILLTDMQRWSEASKALHSARSVFEEADRRRYVLTFHQEAVIRSESGDYLGAAKTIGDVIGQVRSWGDRDELARLYCVAAYAWEGAGDLEAAQECLNKAMVLHAEAGASVEIAMDVWRLGSLMAKRQLYTEAYVQFTTARRMLEQLSLPKYILNLEFDVLEAKIAQGVTREEIATLCRRSFESSQKDLPVNAAHALAWLREAALLLDIETVRQVRTFVRDSHVYRDAAFIPPFMIKDSSLG